MEYNFGPLVPTGVTKYQGRDYNYFNKFTVTWSNFGGGNNGNPDGFISFSTQSMQFINLTVAQMASPTYPGTSVVEYSFNGTTVHGELGSCLQNTYLDFENRVASLIWFRLQSGSSGTVVVSVQAWGTK
jgi:hypothetical protein